MKKLLTIIIPTYNMEKYLNRCLDSLLVSEGNMNKLEVLVINDGSKDASSAIAHEYERKYPGVFYVIDKLNGNYGSCINTALKIASGKFVKVLDADDYFDTNSFNELFPKLGNTNTDAIITGHTIININKRYTSNYSYYDGQIINLKETCPEYFSMHNLIYKLELLKEINYKQTEGISYTDQEWIFYPILHAQTLTFYNLNIYQYVLGREGQTMNELTVYKNIQAIESIIKRMLIELIEIGKELNTSYKMYAERTIYIQMRLIYKTELIMLPKEDSHMQQLSELEQLTKTFDTSYYHSFNKIRIKKIPYVFLYRKGLIFNNIFRCLIKKFINKS